MAPFIQTYDTTLKALLQAASDTFFQQVVGAPITSWLNVETPQVQNLRLDLLGLTADQTLVHIELQSTNDSDMALRMAEYCLRIARQRKKFARQIVLYVGEAEMKMPARLSSHSLEFSYTLLDVRQLDTERLLSSPRIEDNLLAILTSLRDSTGTIREILARIADLSEPDRGDALLKLLLISGLRHLVHSIKHEAQTQTMPILNDILDHELFGPKIRQGMQEEAQRLAKIMLETRFGPLSATIQQQLSLLSEKEIEKLTPLIVTSSSLSEIFPKT